MKVPYEDHRRIVLSLGMTQETFKAQRELLETEVKHFASILCRTLENVPNREFTGSPEYIRTKLKDLIKDMAR